MTISGVAALPRKMPIKAVTIWPFLRRQSWVSLIDGESQKKVDQGSNVTLETSAISIKKPVWQDKQFGHAEADWYTKRCIGVLKSRRAAWQTCREVPEKSGSSGRKTKSQSNILLNSRTFKIFFGFCVQSFFTLSWRWTQFGKKEMLLSKQCGRGNARVTPLGCASHRSGPCGTADCVSLHVLPRPSSLPPPPRVSGKARRLLPGRWGGSTPAPAHRCQRKFFLRQRKTIA